MNTLDAFELILAVQDALEKTKYMTDREKTRGFLEALHERGLSICGQAKPATPALHEVA